MKYRFKNMNTIILSGGIGSRLWPISTCYSPKQFIRIRNELSLLQEAYIRAIEIGSTSIMNVTNEDYFYQSQQEWENLPLKNKANLSPQYILEPLARGTAASIAIGALTIEEKYGGEAILLILPSDHLIFDSEGFIQALSEAKLLAKDGKIVTLGIRPDSFDTSYGYIKSSGRAVEKFIEKPNIAKVIEYVNSGEYLWNSGILCFTAKTMIREMEKHCPEIISRLRGSLIYNDQNILTIDPKCFKNIPLMSIDHSIMEKSDKISVVCCDIGWADLGNWDRMSQALNKDDSGNVIKSHSIIDKVRNCYIDGGDKLIAAVGLNDLVIVDTPSALLVAGKEHAEDVKNIYNKLPKSSGSLGGVSKKFTRPWGHYSVIESGDGFKIKYLEVNPGMALSLQSHQHRAEHWIGVAGEAKVTHQGQELILKVDGWVYIAAGSMHQLSNHSTIDKLVVIEVQTGGYLEEDDIERFDHDLLYSKIS